MQLQNCMERHWLKVTNETVETVGTSGDTCKYKLMTCMERQRERLKETKEAVEIMETSGDTHKCKIL